jgi:ATP-binding cassette, subfamily F, member 3
LRAIAKEDGIEGFPKHLRVLHVRQEVPSHLSEDMTVLQAVLDSDIERNMLMQEEKELLAKLEQTHDNGGKEASGAKLSAAAIAENNDMTDMNADLKKLDEIAARLRTLSSESAESRVALILSGLQFTPAMQTSTLSSLSGGWRMRVA